MTTAATVLLDFFDLQARQQHRADARPLLEACNSIDDELRAEKTSGKIIEPFEQITSYIRTILFQNMSEDMATIITHGSGKCELGGPLRDLLTLFASTRGARPPATESAIASLRDLLRAARDAALTDESLNPALRNYLLQSVSALEAELDAAEVSGSFALHDALARLMGWIRYAEESSTYPDRWSRIWKEWGRPVAQGLLISAPQIALSAGTAISHL